MSRTRVLATVVLAVTWLKGKLEDDGEASEKDAPSGEDLAFGNTQLL